jgi:type I restriction enzyme S subunit
MTWPVVRLGEVADTALGKMLDKAKIKGHAHVPYLRNVNVQWGRIDTDDLLTMELAEDERERFAVRKGDLLVCEGGEIGRCAIWHGRTDYLAYQKALHRIRPSDMLDTQFLRYLMEHHSLSGQLAKLATGTTIAHLPQQQLRRVPVPLPPLDEQHRIVDLLEDHLSRLDAADAYLEAAQRRANVLYDQLLASELAALESAELPLAELLAEGLANGKSVPTQENGFPVLRLTALRDGHIDLAERKPGAWTAADAKRFLVNRGDFLIARGNGSLRLVGRGGLITDEPDAVAFPDTLIRARPDLTRVHPEFMAYVWNAPGVRRQIEKAAKTTAGIYKVNQKDLAAVRVPVPSLADQERVVAAVRESRDALSRLAREVGRAVARSSALRRSLLGAAFSGRLTGDACDQSEAEEMINA